MIALYLIAAHLVGDFVFQTRWQSERKFDQPIYRVRHVTTYTLAFVPVVALCWQGPFSPMFLPALWTLHFLTDSRRFTSTLGDWIAWRWWIPDVRKYHVEKLLPENPWPPIALAIDQTLHVVQIAVLAGLFLS